MPWTRLTEEQKFEAYKEICIEAQKQGEKDVDMLIKSFMIRGELLKRDFTKRQMTIIMFIFTFSYLYGKEFALIPKLQDFEICGISKTKIKSELRKLEEMNVVIWYQEENLFGINNPFEWETSYNAGFNDVRGKELFMLNLAHAGVDVSHIIEKIKRY